MQFYEKIGWLSKVFFLKQNRESATVPLETLSHFLLWSKETWSEKWSVM